jgi:DNA phosphorothioation-associated putative methyltransferase
MNVNLLRNFLLKIKVGKRVGTSLYFHQVLANTLPISEKITLKNLCNLAQVESDHFNIFKINLRKNSASLLYYPDFWSSGFPRLESSWFLNLDTNKVSYRHYDIENSPILHRKELLLPKDHVKIPLFSALTTAAENAHLFSSPSTIGRRKAWEDALTQKGLQVYGHELQPLHSIELATMEDKK